VKLVDLVNQGNLGEVETRIAAVLAKVPFLHGGIEISRSFGGVRVRAGEEWTLLVLHKPKVSPKDVGAVCDEISQHITKESHPKAYGVVSAPFLSNETSRRIHERCLGTIDLSGNCHLSFGSVYIEATGKENRFKEARDGRSLFAPRAQRVIRILLEAPLRRRTGKELSAVSDVSQGWVSSVRQGLVAREWASTDARGIIVTRPRDLLAAWAELDRWEDRTEVHEFSSVLPRGDIVEGVSEMLSEVDHAFTQWTAAERRRPAVESEIVTVYVEHLPEERELKERLLARPLDRSGNFRLVVPKDRGVFLGRQIIQGLPLVSDAQMWLDLRRAGNRGSEQAEALWNWEGFGGWAK
jgi:hypothetical protein